MGDGRTVTWRELWADATRATGQRAVGRWLCEVASGFDGDELVEQLEAPATQRGVACLDAMVARLAGGEPLQYVLGRWGFRRLDLMVDRRVLIPRPETELVVDAALGLAREIARPMVVVDLGTGSGAIGLSMAAELPLDGVTVWLTDVSSDAIDVARANLAGLGRRAANVRVAQGTWFTALPADLRGRVDLVVTNPPYVAERDPEVEDVVSRWEPGGALFAGADGLDAIRAIASASPGWLRPGGWLVTEIGARQAAAVTGVLVAAGLTAVEVRPDLAGLDRIAIARRGSDSADG